MFYHASRARETKRTKVAYASTIEDKLRRHRNKERIWRRCVLKLAAAETQQTAP